MTGFGAKTCSANGEGDEEDCAFDHCNAHGRRNGSGLSGRRAGAGAAEPHGGTDRFLADHAASRLAIRPGETETIPLTLRNSNQPPQRASIEVSGIPQNWKWSLKGGNREVSAVIVGPDATQEVKLELTPPEGAAGDRVAIDVRARYGDQVAELPLSVGLSSEPERGLELKPELPALRGTASSTFSFKVDVTNDGDESLFNLVANVPHGFQTRFKRGYGSEEITGLPIEAGATETVTLEVTPPRSTPAGR
ncbi:NEW3 domain-containing protein [Sinorhizobium meliloti]|uniref:COG1470 family protein n=1 Tax=Rhizobium meliloti TaxID=382 RepID=UPI001F29EB8C|nr:NEW3 domain-containing protein [Sinorhizobium meliloti]